MGRPRGENDFGRNVVARDDLGETTENAMGITPAVCVCFAQIACQQLSPVRRRRLHLRRGPSERHHTQSSDIPPRQHVFITRTPEHVWCVSVRVSRNTGGCCFVGDPDHTPKLVLPCTQVGTGNYDCARHELAEKKQTRPAGRR